VPSVITMAHGQGGAEIGFDRGPTLTCNHEAPIAAYVTHSLRGEGFDASEDGTGRGTPLVPVAFDTTQITSKANGSNPQPGDPCHPLAAGAHAPAIAFSAKDYGGDAMAELSPTLRAGGHNTSHANAGVMPAIAFPANLSGTQHATTEDLAPAMGAKNPTAVAHVELMPTMTAGGPSDTSHNQVSGQMRDAYMVPTTAMQVRRLTPTECERLQGFPDGWTAIPWRGKPADQCPDGPRYKALGNSWAVPNVRWLGRRISDAISASEARAA